MCDIGSALNKELVECTILEGFQQTNYGVRFVTKEGKSTNRIMPVSRIRRKIVKDDDSDVGR